MIQGLLCSFHLLPVLLHQWFDLRQLFRLGNDGFFHRHGRFFHQAARVDNRHLPGGGRHRKAYDQDWYQDPE
jgi:hypothetical protein